MVIYISQPYSMCIGSCFMKIIFEWFLNRYTQSNMKVKGQHWYLSKVIVSFVEHI